MSSRGSRGHSSCGHHGHQGEARAESYSMGNMPNLETSEPIGTPATEIGSQTPTIGDMHYPKLCYEF